MSVNRPTAEYDLVRNGERLTVADDARRDAMSRLRKSIKNGVDAGLTVTEIARLSGVSRQTVYEIVTPSSDKS